MNSPSNNTINIMISRENLKSHIQYLGDIFSYILASLSQHNSSHIKLIKKIYTNNQYEFPILKFNLRDPLNKAIAISVIEKNIFITTNLGSIKIAKIINQDFNIDLLTTIFKKLDLVKSTIGDDVFFIAQNDHLKKPLDFHLALKNIIKNANNTSYDSNLNTELQKIFNKALSALETGYIHNSQLPDYWNITVAPFLTLNHTDEFKKQNTSSISKPSNFIYEVHEFLAKISYSFLTTSNHLFFNSINKEINECNNIAETASTAHNVEVNENNNDELLTTTESNNIEEDETESHKEHEESYFDTNPNSEDDEDYSNADPKLLDNHSKIKKTKNTKNNKSDIFDKIINFCGQKKLSYEALTPSTLNYRLFNKLQENSFNIIKNSEKENIFTYKTIENSAYFVPLSFTDQSPNDNTEFMLSSGRTLEDVLNSVINSTPYLELQQTHDIEILIPYAMSGKSLGIIQRHHWSFVHIKTNKIGAIPAVKIIDSLKKTPYDYSPIKKTIDSIFITDCKLTFDFRGDQNLILDHTSCGHYVMKYIIDSTSTHEAVEIEGFMDVIPEENSNLKINNLFIEPTNIINQGMLEHNSPNIPMIKNGIDDSTHSQYYHSHSLIYPIIDSFYMSMMRLDVGLDMMAFHQNKTAYNFEKAAVKLTILYDLHPFGVELNPILKIADIAFEAFQGNWLKTSTSSIAFAVSNMGLPTFCSHIHNDKYSYNKICDNAFKLYYSSYVIFKAPSIISSFIQSSMSLVQEKIGDIAGYDKDSTNYYNINERTQISNIDMAGENCTIDT